VREEPGVQIKISQKKKGRNLKENHSTGGGSKQRLMKSEEGCVDYIKKGKSKGGRRPGKKEQERKMPELSSRHRARRREGKEER